MKSISPPDPDADPEADASASAYKTKSVARQFARDYWLGLAAPARAELTEKITSHWQKFIQSLALDANARVLAFLALSDEIDPLPGLIASGCAQQIYVPRTAAAGEMDFAQFQPGRDRPTAGHFRVPGAAAHAVPLDLPVRSSDVVVIPALGASASGVRLGRGAGYYDRWRERMQPATRVGLLPAALAQLDFAGEAFDICFNYIITEEGCGRR